MRLHAWRITALSCSRRDFLVRGLYGIGVGAGLPAAPQPHVRRARRRRRSQGTSVEKHPERILVVIELSGGNDGLNTVVPFGDPAYYRARPKLGIAEARGASRPPTASASIPRWSASSASTRTAMLGVVHGCGYDHPSLSHFSSMGFWHTGVPNGGEPLGWLGRLADETYHAATQNMIVNLGNSQSLAVRSAQHSPLVFDDPARFRREGTDDEKQALAELSQPRDDDECHARVPRRRRRRTRPTARTSCARHPPSYRRRWTTAPAAASPAISSASPRSSPPACRRASTTSPTRATRSTPTCSRPTSTAGC